MKLYRTWLADALKVAIVDARTDMQVEPYQMEAVLLYQGNRQGKLRMPDAVFAVFSTRVGFLAVAVPEAGIDAQPHAMAR